MTQIITQNGGGGGGSGSGNVVGPASSVNENIAIFDGNTGKVIKDSGINLDDKQDTLTAGTDLEIIDHSDPTTVDGIDEIELENARHNRLNSVTLYGKSSFLAEGYQQVEYLQSTSTQYINTGFVIPDMTDNYQIDMKLMVDGGTGNPGQSNNLGYMGINSVLMLVYTRDNGIGITTDGVPYVADHISSISFKRGSDLSRSVTVDGTEFTMTDQATLYDDRAFGIFRLSPFDQTYNICYGKIYEFKAYHNGELVMNLVPCRRISDSELGMYDTINKTFLTNEGTGTFTAGNDIIPTPTAPLPIQCNNGQINIFCGEKFNTAGQTTGYIINTDGSITENSNYNITAPVLLKKGAYTVTFKDTVVSSGRIYRAYDYTDPSNPVRIFTTSSTAANTLISFDLNLNRDYQKVRVCYRTSMTEKSIKPKNPIITIDGPTETVEDGLGNTATAEMLLGVTNGTTTIQDTQEVLSGAVTRNIGFKIFTSSDVIEYQSQSSNKRFVVSAGALSSLGLRLTPIFCTHFQTIDDGRSLDDVPNMSIYGATTNNLYMKYTSYTSKSAFGNWLDAQFDAGTPVVAIYPLETPTTETVDGQTLDVIDGDNTLTIIQAHLKGLGISANYYQKGATINFTNDTGYITAADVPVYTAGTGISIEDYVISADGSGGNGDVVGPEGATSGNLAVFDGSTGKLIKDGGAVPVVPTIVDDLTTQSTTSTLSANQGYVLKGLIDALSAQGRFLSLWNCATGMPISFPHNTPYVYLTGDYYIVETLDTVGDPAVNYRPTGSSYTGTASSTAETGEVEVGDYYVYDGTVWLLASNHGKDVTFSNIAGQPSDNANLSTALNSKQNNRIDVTVSTAAATAAKVGSTTAGNYTPTKGDFLLVNFVNGCSVASPTLKIDNGSAIAIRTGNAAATTGTLALGDTSNSNIKALFYYDGTYYRCWSTTNSNTTYSAMSVSEGQTGTATTARTMRADRLKEIIKYHAVSDTAYGSSWDGKTEIAPSQNAVYDKIQSLNLPIISASAPATPTEGMIWYDTTNDKLKTYDGSNWNECGSGGGGSGDVTGPASSTDGNVVLFDGATGKIIKDSGTALSSKADATDVNTKTFYLSSTSDTTTGQAILDWYLVGKNPVVIYNDKCYVVSNNDISSTLRLVSNALTKITTSSGDAIASKDLRIAYNNNNEVTGISTGSVPNGPTVLSTAYNGDYTPTQNGNPATKKYVDDSVSVVSGDSGTTYTIKVSNSAPASGTPNTTITFVV